MGFTFRGAFDNNASYAVNNVVSYSGSSYVATAANQGPNNPTPDQNAAWSLVAQGGTASTTGQSATTAVGTGALTVFPNSGLTQVPGLSVTVNVPTNAVVIAASNGGFQTQSLSTTGFSQANILISVDGSAFSTVQDLLSMNSTLVGVSTNWSLTQAFALSPGQHTVAVDIIGSGAGSAATVSGDSASTLQGALTVTVLKQ